jgi:hypothetical protein
VERQQTVGIPRKQMKIASKRWQQHGIRGREAGEPIHRGTLSSIRRNSVGHRIELLASFAACEQYSVLLSTSPAGARSTLPCKGGAGETAGSS